MKSRKAGCPRIGYEDLATLRDRSFLYPFHICQIAPSPPYNLYVGFSWIRIDIDNSVFPIYVDQIPVVGLGSWLIINDEAPFNKHRSPVSSNE